MATETAVTLENAPLMSRDDVATYLNISLRQVDKFSDAGVLTRIWVGGQIRYRRSAIEEYLDAQTEKVAATAAA